ncbi:uncharacterized protein G2W53_010866 [Senna tora]|uniref:Uncharacterized protein n=1 Tax=Senna tora TaxID=362788 RepID=A0A834X1U8_9FABA|nr:uncharacterized protein G2W53_010866 [Senna tora]
MANLSLDEPAMEHFVDNGNG